MPERRARFGPILYAASLVLIAVLTIVALAGSRTFQGHYVRPGFFRTARALFYLQQGLFVAGLAALGGWLAGRVSSVVVRCLLFVPALALLVWLLLWGSVYSRFGIRLSLGYLAELLTQPGSMTAVGLTSSEFAWLSLIGLLTIVLLAIGIERAARASGQAVARRAAILCGLSFVPVHVPVRTYLAYHVSHNQRAALALDDATPLPLRSEAVVPHLRRHRLTLANLSDPARTTEYVSWVKQTPQVKVPRPLDVLWIMIESFRHDAINENATPWLFAHRNEFQLRLDQNHWSGGNATRAGVFTMLTGIAAYHFSEFRRGGVTFPLLRLLAAGGYRVRIGKTAYFNYADLRSLLPAEVVLAQRDPLPFLAGDHAMVESFLADYASAGATTRRFDILSFESTHWPYAYPAEHAIFQPATIRLGLTEYLLPAPELAKVRNRYRNSCHFIDAEIGVVLDQLKRSGAWGHTIVLITGDHGEEFRERDQLAHSGGMNDFQGRVPLWIHVPDVAPAQADPERLTTSLDNVPTLLQLLGFSEDVLRTQGTSLLENDSGKSLVGLAEPGVHFPQYVALVSDTYISRWRHGQQRFLFSGVERRDGQPVSGDAWWQEVLSWRDPAAVSYEVLPDVRQPLRHFSDHPTP